MTNSIVQQDESKSTNYYGDQVIFSSETSFELDTEEFLNNIVVKYGFSETSDEFLEVITGIPEARASKGGKPKPS